MPTALLKVPSSIFLDQKTGPMPEVVGVVALPAEVVAVVDQMVVAGLEEAVEGRSDEWMIFEDRSARVVSEVSTISFDEMSPICLPRNHGLYGSLYQYEFKKGLPAALRRRTPF
jgi:hypothetical protein